MRYMDIWVLLNGSFFAVADVQDAETQFNAHEFLDATTQPKAIHVTPNEVYTVHTILTHHLDQLVRIFFREPYC